MVEIKKVALITGSILLVIFVAIGSYILGTRNAPTQIIEPNSVLSEQSTSTPTPTVRGRRRSPTPTPDLKTQILSSTPEFDGFRSSVGGGSNAQDIRVGRNVNLVSRGFVSFDISSLPSDATLIEATLRIYQAKIEGAPFAVGGAIKVDHLTLGDSLDAPDYSSPALSSSFTTLTNSSRLEWKEVDVLEPVRNDLANARSQSQFRVHFDRELAGGDFDGDFVFFESAENELGTGNTPQLVVKYY